MTWFPKMVLYLGFFDAAMIMAGGVASAAIILAGWDAKKFWERVWPAVGVLIGSNIAAVIVLWGVSKIAT